MALGAQPADVLKLVLQGAMWQTLAARRSGLLALFASWLPARHHLLTHYRVPGFMDSAWDLAAGPEAFRQQSWFIRLGRGTAVRALNLPLVLTRSMEHYVRQAPDHYTALRYGETRGLGGSEELGCEIDIGSLGQRIEHADFWRTVLSFFVAHPEMKLEHVNPIVDFIHANKFASDEVLSEGGTEIRNPPWPDFSMKGRTLKSILRLVTAWHSDLAANKPDQRFSWRKSGNPRISVSGKTT